jgi:hypothetical protein
MKNYFKGKISFAEIDEKGNSQKITEEFLINAFSYTEAETLIAIKAESECYGELSSTTITKNNTDEILFSGDLEAPKWYKVVVKYSDIDEKGKQNNYAINVMVYAADIDSAIAYMRFAYYEIGHTITSVSETKIVGIINYKED